MHYRKNIAHQKKENKIKARELLNRLKLLKDYLCALDKALNILKAKNFQDHNARYRIQDSVLKTTEVLRDIRYDSSHATVFLNSFIALVNRAHYQLYGNDVE